MIELAERTGERISAVLQIPLDVAQDAVDAAQDLGDLVALRALWRRVYALAVAVPTNPIAQDLAQDLVYFCNSLAPATAPLAVQVQVPEVRSTPIQSLRRGRDLLAHATPLAVIALAQVTVTGRRDRDRIRAAELLLTMSARLQEEDLQEEPDYAARDRQITQAMGSDLARARLTAIRERDRG